MTGGEGWIRFAAKSVTLSSIRSCATALARPFSASSPFSGQLRMCYSLPPMKRLSSLVAVMVLLIAGRCSGQQSLDAVTRANALVEEFIKQEPVPALTVAIDGRIVYSKGFGQADIENDVKATPETVIRTGSIAKPISAVAAMTLVEAGKLDLDAPV